jgi:predicted RNA-binding protein with PIN domain
LLTSSEVIIPKTTSLARKYRISDEELEAIMLRATGPIKRPKYSEPKVNSADKDKKKQKIKPQAPRKNMVIVDGYNLIYSWDNIKEISEYSLEKARETLMDILSNYVAYTKVELVLVFDAYLVKDGEGSDFKHDNYRVVYTRQDQTADAFIEKMMHELGPDYSVRVVTGDRLVQNAAVHSGVLRMTTKEFEAEVTRIGKEIDDFVKKLAASKMAGKAKITDKRS